MIYCWILDSFKYVPQFTLNSYSSVFNTFYLKWKKYAQHLLRRIPVNLFCARVAALKSLLIQGKFVWMPYLIDDMMMSTMYMHIELLRIWPHLNVAYISKCLLFPSFASHFGLWSVILLMTCQIYILMNYWTTKLWNKFKWKEKHKI